MYALPHRLWSLNYVLRFLRADIFPTIIGCISPVFSSEWDWFYLGCKGKPALRLRQMPISGLTLARYWAVFLLACHWPIRYILTNKLRVTQRAMERKASLKWSWTKIGKLGAIGSGSFGMEVKWRCLPTTSSGVKQAEKEEGQLTRLTA